MISFPSLTLPTVPSLKEYFHLETVALSQLFFISQKISQFLLNTAPTIHHAGCLSTANTLRLNTCHTVSCELPAPSEDGHEALPATQIQGTRLWRWPFQPPACPP